jgi:hypothetical protein
MALGFRSRRVPSRLTSRSSRPRVVASAACFALRLHASAAPPQGGLTPALGAAMRLLIPCITFFALSFSFVNANACSCPATENIEEQMRDSVLVLAAKPISLSTEKSRIRRSERDFPVEIQTVVWRVVKSWRGKFKAGDEFRTRTTHANGQCGLLVRPHRALILYFASAEPTSISQCERSAGYWRFGSEQRRLRRMSKEQPGGT